MQLWVSVIAGDVEAARASWSVNSLAQAIGTRACDDMDFVAATQNFVEAERQELGRRLENIQTLNVFPIVDQLSSYPDRRLLADDSGPSVLLAKASEF